MRQFFSALGCSLFLLAIKDYLENKRNSVIDVILLALLFFIVFRIIMLFYQSYRYTGDLGRSWREVKHEFFGNIFGVQEYVEQMKRDNAQYNRFSDSTHICFEIEQIWEFFSPMNVSQDSYYLQTRIKDNMIQASRLHNAYLYREALYSNALDLSPTYIPFVDGLGEFILGLDTMNLSWPSLYLASERLSNYLHKYSFVVARFIKEDELRRAYNRTYQRRSYQNHYSNNNYNNYNNNQQNNRTTQQKPFIRFEAEYAVLGVSSSTSLEGVKKAYRTLMKQYHPDRFINKSEGERTQANKRSQEINNAYETLKKHLS